MAFDTNLKSFKGVMDSSNLKTINIDNFDYVVPNFLIKQEVPKEIDYNLIKKSLIFTRTIFMNKFFTPNNLIFPKSRIIFENYFN